jgi:hypothetical protein
MADFGVGDGNIIGKDDRINVVDKMFPTDDPAEKAARVVGRYLVPLAGWSAVAKAKGLKDSTAVVGAALTSAAITDPTEGRLTDFVNEFPAARGFVIKALLSKEDDSALVSRSKNFAESVLFDGLTLGAFKGMSVLFGKSMAALRGLKKVKPIVDAADSAPSAAPVVGRVKPPTEAAEGVSDAGPKVAEEVDNVWRPPQKLAPEDQAVVEEAKKVFVKVTPVEAPPTAPIDDLETLRRTIDDKIKAGLIKTPL